LGYAAGHDVSARNFQHPKVSGGQFCYAKSFDAFAPIGPCIVPPSVIPDPEKLKFTTKVNGEVRQSTAADDMIWSVKDILRHCSQGTTIKAGTVFMSGSPNGVGVFCDGLLKDGDVVEVQIEGVGKLVNTMKFDKEVASL
jgi:transcription initiation factor TFIIH subunit 2